jgi:predicted peroxiredoxin
MALVKVLIEITRAPFGHENTFAGLYVASGSLSKGMDVSVVLRGDGVYTGRKGQVDPQSNINLPPTEDQVKDILELGGRILVDKSSLHNRGIEDDELIDGVEILDTNSIHDIILGHGEKVVVF